MKRCFFLPLLLLFFFLPMSAQTAQDSSDPFLSDLYKATAVLYEQGESGSYSPVCTATSIAKAPKQGYVFVTAAHCVSSTNFYFVSTETSPITMLPVVSVERGNEEDGSDYALLFVKTSQELPVISLGNDPSDELGEPVVSVGAPLALGKQVLYGRISNPHIQRPLYIKEDNKITDSWVGNILVQLPGSNPASSGSALVCIKQKAICGIIVGVISSVSNETVALPISRLKEYIKSRDSVSK